MIAALAAAMFGCLPAHAQEDVPELDGGPPPLRIPKQSAPQPARPVTTEKPAKPATTNVALKAEQDRLAKQSAELKAEKARLDARAAQLAAEEQRLAQLRADQDALYTTKMAELARDRAAAQPPPLATPSRATPALPGVDDRGFAPPKNEPQPPSSRPRYARIGYEEARRACTRAGMAEALDRDFQTARYQNSPRFYEDALEFRGLMRLEDRRGFVLVDTICELDAEGRVIDFALLR